MKQHFKSKLINILLKSLDQLRHNSRRLLKRHTIHILPSHMPQWSTSEINFNNKNFLIEPKYADDIIWFQTSKQHIENDKSKISLQLAQYNLEINKKILKNIQFLTPSHLEKRKICKTLNNNTDMKNGKILKINTIKNTSVSSTVEE